MRLIFGIHLLEETTASLVENDPEFIANTPGLILTEDASVLVFGITLEEIEEVSLLPLYRLNKKPDIYQTKEYSDLRDSASDEMIALLENCGTPDTFLLL